MKTKKNIRCEGWRRYGGAFSLGPVTWEQCKNNATVTLRFVQDKKEQTLPACKACWNECLENKLKILEAKPL